MLKVLFDCCVLSNFALSDTLFILKNLYGSSAFLTDFVSAEIVKGIQSGHGGLSRIEDALAQGWLKEISPGRKGERAIWRTLTVSLGLGEASSFAVAKIRGCLFACDDRVARREAERLGVELTGTLGILKKAVRYREVSQRSADRILRRMITPGFFSPVNSIKTLGD
jgi:predicted nucleic acid-binding protein